MSAQRKSEWHKSSYSASQGSCVEVAEGQAVLVRDTQSRELGHLEYPSMAWTSFLQALTAASLR